MKIEKISDNQIKCTLTRQDLEERRIRLSELVYGSDKAKKLFRDMLHLAALQYGFDGEEMPIMVEAIPSSRDSLVLIITKVDNPEELDTRFSQFTPSDEEDYEDPQPEDVFSDNLLQDTASNLNQELEGAFKEVLDKMKQVVAERKKTQQGENSGKGVSKKKRRSDDEYRTVMFQSMEQVGEFSKAVCNDFTGLSNLYKDSATGKYYMVIFLKSNMLENFNRVCNVASEYGTMLANYSLAFYSEHYKLIAKDDAIERVAVML